MPEPTLPAALVMAIGRVAVNGTRLEADVTHTLWSALGHAEHIRFKPIQVPDGGGRFSAPASDFARVIDDLKLLAQNRLTGSLEASFLAYLTRAKTLQNQRHDVVHSMWHARPDKTGRHLMLSTRALGAKRRMSVSDVDKLATDIHIHRGVLVKLLPPLQSAMPETRSSTTGLPPLLLATVMQFHDVPGTAGESAIVPDARE